AWRVSGVHPRPRAGLPHVAGRDPLDRPPAVAAVADPVVQPAGPALPEFDFVGLDPEPAPIRGQRHIAVGIASLHVLEFGLEHLAGGNHPALVRGPGAEAAPERT